MKNRILKTLTTLLIAVFFGLLAGCGGGGGADLSGTESISGGTLSGSGQ